MTVATLRERIARVASDSRWNTQTILGGDDVPLEQRGDCVRACITSLLGLPMDAVENVQGGRWWIRWQEFVGEHGFSLAIVYPQAEPPASLWIAVVPSLSLVANHSVIARGYDLVHDPGMKRRYTEAEFADLWANDKIREGWVLVPLDPGGAVMNAATELLDCVDALRQLQKGLADHVDAPANMKAWEVRAAREALAALDRRVGE